MKTVKNILLVIALSTTFALADDGHTGGGNRCATCPPPCSTCLTDGTIEDDATTLQSTPEASENSTGPSLIDYFRELFIELVG